MEVFLVLTTQSFTLSKVKWTKSKGGLYFVICEDATYAYPIRNIIEIVERNIT